MKMKNEIIVDILGLLPELQNDCQNLYENIKNNDIFNKIYNDMYYKLGMLLQISDIYKEQLDIADKLWKGSKSCIDSLNNIYLHFKTDKELCLKKIEFELLALLQELYLHIYFFGYLPKHQDKLYDYYTKDICELCTNYYIEDSINKGKYKYDVSIVVLAYNKLEYTKQCVETLLQNLPQKATYEIIFINHGSSDGTKEYFESKKPDKQMDISVNGGGLGCVYRIVEGEFTIVISNDVIVGHNSLDNLIKCIKSDDKIAWAVPSTPNVSNLQSIYSNYSNIDEFNDFTKKNNISDCFRWEQRARLCDPISIFRNSVFLSNLGIFVNGNFHSFDNFSFPDDRLSLLLRRNGYKMMLAKDAYCHHFGSITLKNQTQKKNEQEFYYKGRQEFYNKYKVDPWGTGFCYSVIFNDKLVNDDYDHVDILGINCGLGANSLKIKEQLKEYCHNTDVTLYNITDDIRFIYDLKGVSDYVDYINSGKSMYTILSKRKYKYIIWEDDLIYSIKDLEFINFLLDILLPNGMLICKKRLENKSINYECLNDNWIIYRK